MLTKDELLAAVTKTTRTVEVPDVGPVGVRMMTVAEMARWSAGTDADDAEAMVRLVAFTACNPDGSTMFDGDATPVRAFGHDVVRRLYKAAADANRFTVAAVESDVKN